MTLYKCVHVRKSLVKICNELQLKNDYDRRSVFTRWQMTCLTSSIGNRSRTCYVRVHRENRVDGCFNTSQRPPSADWEPTRSWGDRHCVYHRHHYTAVTDETTLDGRKTLLGGMGVLWVDDQGKKCRVGSVFPGSRRERTFAFARRGRCGHSTASYCAQWCRCDSYARRSQRSRTVKRNNVIIMINNAPLRTFCDEFTGEPARGNIPPPPRGYSIKMSVNELFVQCSTPTTLCRRAL